ncbi:MAG: TIGR00730 family Rossman fold protein [Methylocystaceae bacterium]|jgi:uncharacterized protein (TIGR00730 family)|nr:TIGR00730 family Rossman fold protein [Methylocystaceae bacterium]
MRQIRNICLYCGSASGNDPAFTRAAQSFGRLIATAGIGLVYGGASCGLMGAAAHAALAAGGHVTGVIPDFFDEYEVAEKRISELIIVKDMHERKRIMFERSDAFVAFPGGIGTLEELAEQLTWIQLGQHRKPLIIADINGFWGPLLALISHMRESAFIRPSHEIRYQVAQTVEDILPMILKAAIDEDKTTDADMIKRF